MDHLKDALRQMLLEFQERLAPKDADDFKPTSRSELRQVISSIQKQQENEKRMMDMTRLKSFLDAMDQFGEIINMSLQDSEFVGFIWGSVKFLLKAANISQDFFDILLDAYEQIGEEIPMLENYRTVLDHHIDSKLVLGSMYEDILDFHKSAVRFLSGPDWRHLFRSLWKDFGPRFKHILHRLGRHRDFLERLSALLHSGPYYDHETSQNAYQHVIQYQKDRIDFIEQFERQEQSENDKKYLTVVEWISGTKTSLDHESFCTEREKYPGTGHWILKHEKISNWLEASTPVSSNLWLNGIPGAGKTILASVIVDYCLHAVYDQPFNTCYFYCKETDPEKNNYVSVLKSLLSQLLPECRELVPYCHEKRLSSGELNIASANLAKQLLEFFIQKLNKVYIIIDGLDECNIAERKSIMSLFTSLVEKCDERNPGKLRTLFVSQDYPDIQKALLPAPVVSLAPSTNGRDLERYVVQRSKEIQQKHGLNDQQREDMTELTLARASGMFLFVKLVMTNLYGQTTKGQVLEEIKESQFPDGLKKAYERIMSRIKRDANEAEWKIVQKLLGWMVCARRPLKWHEIQGAVSMNPTSRVINFDDDRLRVHIRDLCGSLVQVLPGDRVELVHSTAKLYIKNTGFVHEATVECNLTCLCVQYLTFKCFGEEVTKDQLRGWALDGYFAFQDYAIAKWFHHLEGLINCGRDLPPLQNEDFHDTIDDLDFALDEFCDTYNSDLPQDLMVTDSEELCNAFIDFDLYGNLRTLWRHVLLHQNKDFETRNNVSIEALKKALERNRKILEELMSPDSCPSTGTRQQLKAHYGNQLFKCPKLTCFYFHEGFRDAKSRDEHVNRHNRPFRCTFPDCSLVEFGFANNRDLEKHMRSFHPDAVDRDHMFASPSKATSQTNWICDRCGKRFTRGFPLRNHQKTHDGERPYACSECGRAFTRLNDCKRHEKIHARRR